MVDAEYDERLREDAARALGAHGDDLAREAIEAGGAAIEGVVSSWESSHGPVRGVRVRLEVGAEVIARLASRPAAMDALQAAFAAAVAKRGPGEVLAELAVRWGVVEAARSSPYRGGVGRRRGDKTPALARDALERYLAERGRGRGAEDVSEAERALFGEEAERVATRR